MPEKTTALINSAIAPIGKLATRISDWLRGSQARDPDPDLARPAARVGVQVDRQAGFRGGRPDRLPHLVHDRLGREHPVEDDPGRQAELRDPQQFGDRLFGGLARQRQQHDEAALRLLVQLARPVIDGPHAGGAQFRVLDHRDLLVGAVDEFGIDPVAVHVLAAVLALAARKMPGSGSSARPARV